MGGRVGLPPLTVEIGFGHTPADLKSGATITWTDVTEWLRLRDSLSWSRGRSGELDTVQAGRASFTLNTVRASDGATFHGGNPLLIRTPVRITWAGGAGPPVQLWTGTVDDWTGGWTNGVRAFTAVSCSDLVARVTAQPIEALPVQAVLAADPIWCYPMDEESGAVTAADRVGHPGNGRLSINQVGTGGAADFGVGYSPGSLSTAAETTVVSFTPVDASNYRRLLSSAVGAVTPHGGATVHLMMLPGVVQAATVAASLAADLSGLTVKVSAAGKAVATFTPTSGTAVTATGTTTLTTAAWWHLAATVTVTAAEPPTVAVELFVNGTSEATASGSIVATSPNLTTLAVGGTGWNGNIANVAAHAGVLDDATITEIAGGRNGWDNDLTSARVDRIAGFAGWTETDVGTGLTAMCQQATKDTTLADALQTCANTELMPWWVDGAGRIRFAGRDARYEATAAYSLPAALLDPGTAVVTSDVGLINKVTATRPTGSQVTRVNTESVDAYETYAQDFTLHVRSDTDLEDIATGMVGLHADPQPRSDSITFDLWLTQSTLGGDLAAAVGSDIGDLVTITGLPDDHSGSEVSFFVEGVADTVSTSGWQRTLNVSPASAYAVWVLDDDTYSVLDATTRLGF